MARTSKNDEKTWCHGFCGRFQQARVGGQAANQGTLTKPHAGKHRDNLQRERRSKKKNGVHPRNKKKIKKKAKEKPPGDCARDS